MGYLYDGDLITGDGVMEEEEKKSKIKTILRMGTMGGRIRPNGKTIHLYIPPNPKVGSKNIYFDLSRVREVMRIKPLGKRRF